MNKNILIISSTSRNNLTLAKNLQSICSDLNMDNQLINLEELDIPLYTPIEEEKEILKKATVISSGQRNMALNHSSRCQVRQYSSRAFI